MGEGVTIADWFRHRFTARGIEPSGASILTTTYGVSGNETILPYLLNGHSNSYKGNSIVFGAILARISLFSEATFAFQDLETKKLSGTFAKDGRSNTSLRKLENPWPNGQTGDLLARMVQDVDLAGNSYIWDAGSQLVRLRPDWITIISRLESDGLGREYRTVVGYFYDPPIQFRETAGQPHLFTVDEVAHWAPIPDPEASFRGMSWLTPVAREISADIGMTAYKQKYLDNAASPNLLIKYSQRLGDATVKRIANRIQATHGGMENAFGTLVLDEGADVTTIGNSFEQMNFSTVQAAGENRILIASGVPGIVVGSKEGLMAATYSNYEQAMRRFADVTMRPLWRSACAALSKLVTIPSGSRLWFDTSDIAALRQGETEKAQTLLELSKAAALLKEAGWKPDSIVEALSAGDINLLEFDTSTPPTLPPALTPSTEKPPIYGTPPIGASIKPNGSQRMIGSMS